MEERVHPRRFDRPLPRARALDQDQAIEPGFLCRVGKSRLVVRESDHGMLVAEGHRRSASTDRFEPRHPKGAAQQIVLRKIAAKHEAERTIRR